MKTLICGVDGSPGARAALRVAATLVEQLGAPLVAVHVLDRLAAPGATAERLAASELYDEAPDARAEAPDALAGARGEVRRRGGAPRRGHTGGRRADDRPRRSQPWPLAHVSPRALRPSSAS